MIFITGDTHAHIDIGKLSTEKFPLQKNLTKKDYVIICGDFGLVWDNSRREAYWRKWLEDKNFTTLFVDGNHCNFDMFTWFPDKEMFGGTVQEIGKSIFHLKRGQIYDIDGYKIFTMGGASSHDKEGRIEHVSWWKEELPNTSEMEFALSQLEKANWEVDFVVSHCLPQQIVEQRFHWTESDVLTRFFDEISIKLKFDKWFCGHYHIDEVINQRYIVLFNNILCVDEWVDKKS